MAIDFTDASLLGYNVRNEFLGEQSLNHRKVISLDIQGFVEEGKRVGNQEGVRHNFIKMNEHFKSAKKDYLEQDHITINGRDFGHGRVLNFEFDSAVGTTDDMIRYGQYSASLEVYHVGYLDNIPGASSVNDPVGSYLEPRLLNNFPQYIESWDENLDIKQESDGSASLNMSVKIKMIKGAFENANHNHDETSPILIAKSLAASLIGNSELDYLERTPEAFYFFDDSNYSVIAGAAPQWSEDYDMINFSFSFSKSVKVLSKVGILSSHMKDNAMHSETAPGTYDYTVNTTRSLQKDEFGMVSVTEKGEVQGFAGDWHDTTGGLFVELWHESAGSYARCSSSFLKFVDGQQGAVGLTRSTYSLDNLSPCYRNLGTQLDSGAAKATWTISYNNKSGCHDAVNNEYTTNLTRDKNNGIRISTQGKITSRSPKNAYWDSFTEMSSNPAVEASHTEGYAENLARDDYWSAVAFNNSPVSYYIQHAVDDVFYLTEKFSSWYMLGGHGGPGNAAVGGHGTPIKLESQKISWPKYGKTIDYNLTFSNNPLRVTDEHDSNLKTIEVKVSDAAPKPMTKPYIVPSRGMDGEVVHDPGVTEIGARSIEIAGQRRRQCGMSYITGSVAGDYKLYDFSKSLNYMHDEAMRVALNTPQDINFIINDLWVDNVIYSFNSQGQVSFTMDLKYTGPRNNPSNGVFVSNNSNYGGSSL